MTKDVDQQVVTVKKLNVGTFLGSVRSTAAGKVECALHGYWPLDIPLRLCRAFGRSGHFPLTLRAQGSWSLADFLV